MNLYKITFKAKDKELANLEIYTTAKSEQNALDKISAKLWQDADYERCFNILTDDYVNFETGEILSDKAPQVDYITNFYEIKHYSKVNYKELKGG